MKKQYPHTDAVNFLTNHALPTDEEIDAMDPAQLAAFLSGHGVDVAKFNTELGDLQKHLTGKCTLEQARQLRLAEEAAAYEADLSHLTEADFKSALLEKFGSFESMPLAARNQKSMNREDWEGLYRDHFMSPKK